VHTSYRFINEKSSNSD